MHEKDMSFLFYLWFILIASFWIDHSQPRGVSDVFDAPAIMAGDVVIGGLFDIYYTKQRVNCDVNSVDVYSVMEMEAVKWSLKRLNDIEFIPGVSLGFLAYPTCGVPSVSALQANKFLQLLRENKTPNKTKKPVYIKAVIGPAFSSESEVVSRMLSSVPDDYQLLQMSYASTAAFLTDVAKTNLYPNFFRTIPSDQIQIQAIVHLLVRLEWTYIGIFHSGDAYGTDAARELREALAKKRICVAATYNCNNVHSKLRNHYHEILLNITALKIKGIVLIGDSEMALAFIESIGTGSFIQYHPIPSIIFSESIGLQSQTFINSDSGQVFPATKGSFVLSPPHKEVGEFSEHWNSLFFNESKYKEEVKSNPWLEHMYITKHKYSNAKTFLTKYPASTFVRYAIMATYSVAKIIKDIHFNICSGRRGLCTDMKENRGADTITTASRTVVDFEKDFDQKARLENLTEQITFSKGGDVNFHKTDLVYEVYNYQAPNKSLDFKFVKVGSLKKIESLVKDQIMEFSFSKDKAKFYNDRGMVIEEVKSVCQPNTTCTKCLLNHDNKTPLYIPGDLIVVVTFPIHDRSVEPLHCGPVRRSIGLDVALGAKFVIEKLNKEKDFFPNKQIGLLLLDTCDDPLLTSDSILELHQLHGKLNNIVPGISDKILGYAGGFSSTPTLQVAEITTELKMVQVSCCATSDLLSDRLNYPYFVGLATPLNYTTQVMLKMVQKLGSSHIQVLFTDGKYGESAVRLIRNLAPSFNICVTQTVQVDYDDNSINNIILNLRRYPASRYILAYIASPLMPRIAKAINADMNRLEFLFIGDNSFNHRDYMLKYPNLRKSLLVAEHKIPQSDEYKSYLRNMDPTFEDMQDSEPLIYFMQENLNCYYDFSFRKKFPQKCHRGLHKFPEHLDPWTPYLIQSTTALVKGAYSAIQHMCKEETICAEYRNNPQQVVEHIKNVTLDLDGDDVKNDQLFDSNGNGVLGLKIYSIEEDFIEVGEWQHGRDDINFEIERNGLKIYPSESICEDVIKSVQNSVIKEENSIDLNLIKTVLLSISAGIIIILLVAFICLCRKQSYHLSSMSSITTTKSEYNSIDDLSIINMKRINSDVSLKLSEIFRTDSPCETPKSVRCMCDTKEHIFQQRNEKLSSSNKSSPIIPHFKSFPGSSLGIPSQQKILHQRLRSEPVLKRTSPNTTRRLNSEPLPPVPKLCTESVDMPYIREPKSRRQHSEPTLPTSNFNRLLFQNRNRKESLQDHGYISPITGYDEEDLQLHHFHESVHEQTDQTSKDNVVFVVGNPEEHIQVYSC